MAGLKLPILGTKKPSNDNLWYKANSSVSDFGASSGGEGTPSSSEDGNATPGSSDSNKSNKSNKSKSSPRRLVRPKVVTVDTSDSSSSEDFGGYFSRKYTKAQEKRRLATAEAKRVNDENEEKKASALAKKGLQQPSPTQALGAQPLEGRPVGGKPGHVGPRNARPRYSKSRRAQPPEYDTFGDDTSGDDKPRVPWPGAMNPPAPPGNKKKKKKKKRDALLAAYSSEEEAPAPVYSYPRVIDMPNSSSEDTEYYSSGGSEPKKLDIGWRRKKKQTSHLGTTYPPSKPITMRDVNSILAETYAYSLKHPDGREIYIFELDCGIQLKAPKLPGPDPARVVACKAYLRVFNRLQAAIKNDLTRVWSIEKHGVTACLNNMQIFFMLLGRIARQASEEIWSADPTKRDKLVDEWRISRKKNGPWHLAVKQLYGACMDLSAHMRRMMRNNETVDDNIGHLQSLYNRIMGPNMDPYLWILMGGDDGWYTAGMDVLRESSVKPTSCEEAESLLRHESNDGMQEHWRKKRELHWPELCGKGRLKVAPFDGALRGWPKVAPMRPKI